MSLTAPPPRRRLPDPTVPFVLYAVWGDAKRAEVAVSNIPGGALGEFAVGGRLAEQVSQVLPEELPICLTMQLAKVGPEGQERGEWVFEYLGSPDEVFAVPAELQPNPPRPQTVAELNSSAETMLRESLGIPEGEPIPEPAGPLPPEQRPEEPYRFDPTPHMDLTVAEAAPPLPEPAPPGPTPAPNGQTSPVPQIPPPARGLGSYGDKSIPFGS